MTTTIPEAMLAVCLNESDGQLLVRSVPVPKPGKGEVLVKIAAAPVNPSDLTRIKNLPGPEDRRSFIAGIEGSGTVIAHGEGLLPHIWMGRRVACSSTHNSSGTWAEYMVTSAMSCIPLPGAVSFEQGSMMLINPLTAIAFYHIIRRNRHKAIVSTAAASSLGRFIDLLAKQYHIPVIHIVRNQSQLIDLKSRGAAYILNSSSENFTETLCALAAKMNATLVLDAVGGNFTRKLLLAIPFAGSLIIYGNLSGEQPEIDHRSLVTDNKKIAGFYLVNWLREQNMLTTISCILKARKMIRDNISIPVQAKFPIDKVQQAVDTYLGNMTSGKVLLVP